MTCTRIVSFTNLAFALPFSTFAECFALGFIYRYKDVIKQIGYSAYLVTVVAYVGPLLFCTLAAVTTSVSGMYLLVVGLAGFLFLMAFAYCICDTPTVYICGDGPVNKIYWLTLYPADQLRKDLNAAISTNGRWEIPLVWSFVMKFVTGPITFLLVVFSLTEINQIFDNVANFVGFLSGICIILFAVFGVIIPRFFDIFLPPGEKNQWKRQFEAGPGIVLEESQELLRKIDGK